MNFLKNLFVTSRFFYLMGALTLTMMLAYPFPFFLPLVKTSLVLFVVACLADIAMLFSKALNVSARRDTAAVFSLGDDNPVEVYVSNRSGLRLWMEVIDELPEQFQVRNFSFQFALAPLGDYRHRYHVRPVVRGEYAFGSIHVYINTALGLVRRRISYSGSVAIPVYPSILQMKKYALNVFARTASEYGVKKVRRIGHSYEFEHIKQYQKGDDYRSVNWKATGRRVQLMVNQYEDERSQPVYCIIDKSRVMHMPFHGLSLFDYAVNASLVISNIALGKQDKAGLITFAERPYTLLKANRTRTQLRKILDALYKEKEGNVEADYESLYMAVRKLVSGRSLLFLYTNFESTYALQRVMPQLRKMNNQHLLVVIFFENTELTPDRSAPAATLEDVYVNVTAEHYALMKIQLMQQLKQFGIFSMLTKPKNLTVDSINKYLELKSRGMI
jgi:uncharacterized protein (DUF58 family)